MSADDIAAVAVRALTDRAPPNTEYLVLGPELLSYGDVCEFLAPCGLYAYNCAGIGWVWTDGFQIAAILSDVLGRRIVHVDLAPAELEKRHQEFGMPEDYARMLSAMDTSIKFGAENRTNDVILAVTGAPPRKFTDFAKSVKEIWEASGSV